MSFNIYKYKAKTNGDKWVTGYIVPKTESVYGYHDLIIDEELESVQLLTSENTIEQIDHETICKPLKLKSEDGNFVYTNDICEAYIHLSSFEKPQKITFSITEDMLTHTVEIIEGAEFTVESINVFINLITNVVIIDNMFNK